MQFPLPLPNGRPSKDVEMLVKIADCVLGDRCTDSKDQPVRYPLGNVVTCVSKMIISLIAEGCEGFIAEYDPKGPLVKATLPTVLGIGEYCITKRNLRGYLQNEFSYTKDGALLRVEDFEPHRAIIEEIWECPVSITRMPDNPMGVTIRPAPLALPAPLPVCLPARIPLVPAAGNSVVLGSDIFTGQVVVVHVRDLPHMLIAGVSGFGKSVFLNQLITQLLRADANEVAELLAVDLKGGVEFHGYARQSNRVRVVWEFDEVVEVVERLVELMLARQREMVANGWRLYPGRRVFFIVDEFAQIQLYPAETKAEKATHARLIANLNRLSMLGRAVGVVLIAAIQKPTTDVMDSSFRMNLQGQVCFKVPNRLLASTMFGSVDELKVDPVTLPRGRFIYYDPIAGTTRYLQAHVVPD